MAPPTKKQLSRGFRGFETDDAEFLRTCNPQSDRGNWDRQEGSQGPYGQAYDDDRGFARGLGAYSGDDYEAGLRNKMPDESQASVRDIGSLIYSQDDQPAGPLLGGGGGVSDNERDPDDSSWSGSGRKGPRYSNPLGAKGQSNARRR